MNGVVTEQIKLFYLYVKCLVMSNQWKEIEPWKTLYFFIPEIQLINNQYFVKEIMKVFTYHSEQYKK
jgi:hypothetical protein